MDSSRIKNTKKNIRRIIIGITAISLAGCVAVLWRNQVSTGTVAFDIDAEQTGKIYEAFETSSYDANIRQLSSSGEEIWRTTFGFGSTIVKIQSSSDGLISLGQNFTNYTLDKLNSLGQVIWHKDLGVQSYGLADMILLNSALHISVFTGNSWDHQVYDLSGNLVKTVESLSQGDLTITKYDASHLLKLRRQYLDPQTMAYTLEMLGANGDTLWQLPLDYSTVDFTNLNVSSNGDILVSFASKIFTVNNSGQLVWQSGALSHVQSAVEDSQHNLYYVSSTAQTTTLTKLNNTHVTLYNVPITNAGGSFWRMLFAKNESELVISYNDSVPILSGNLRVDTYHTLFLNGTDGATLANIAGKSQTYAPICDGPAGCALGNFVVAGDVFKEIAINDNKLIVNGQLGVYPNDGQNFVEAISLP